jgi:hypothetical protein
MKHATKILMAGFCFAFIACAYADSPILNPSFETTIQVTDELVFLQNTVQTPLAHTNVIPSSLVVKNLSGTITYSHGADYAMNTGKSIHRTESSSIPNGSTVKVSYRYCVWQDWTPYSYTIPGGSGLNPSLGAAGGEGTFDVLFPTPPIAPDGLAVCGAQAWANSANGGVRQTFYWGGGEATISVTARAFSVDFNSQPVPDGCRVRMGLVPWASTSRDDVVEWVTFPWGDAWFTRTLHVPSWGTYTLFIESYQPSPLQNKIMSTLWDKVVWQELPLISVTTGPVAVVPGHPAFPDTSARIEWTTNVPCASRVDFGPTDSYGQFVEDPELVTQHSVLLTGLQNSSLYHYRASSSAPGYASWESDDRILKTPIQFSEITAMPSPDGMNIVIAWKTDVPTTTRVEYGLTASYGQSTPEDPALVTDHQVLIGGLAEDTDYHFRVWGTNPPLYSPASSADHVFHTLPDPSPSLRNPGFEDGHGVQAHSLYPWVEYAVAMDGTGYHPIDGLVGPYPAGGGASWFAGIVASEGSYLVGAAANYAYKNGGVYQRVLATPGQPYTLSARFATYRVGGTDRDNRFRLGIDPSGGVDPLSPAVIWRSVSSPTNDSRWHAEAVTATAGPNGLITVFLEIRQQWPLEWHVVAFDDARLGPPLAMSIGELRQAATGLGAVLSDKIVTYVDPDIVLLDDKGYTKAYVEEPDGSAGIAVLFDQNLPDQPAVGNKTTVTGSIVLQGMEAMVLAYDWTLDPATHPLPRAVGVGHRAIGGSTSIQPAVRPVNGPCNVGLRVRVFGKVTWPSFVDPFSDVTVFIDDGSAIANGQPPNGGSPVNGIMARLRANGTSLVAGDYIAVTGVVGITYVDPNGWPDTGDEYYAYIVYTGDPGDWSLVSSAEP